MGVSLQDIISQGEKIDALLVGVERMLLERREAFDRIAHTLQASYTFFENQNTVQELVLNVPDGNDFEGTRFMLYPEVRAFSTDDATQGVSDKVFRPTGWFQDFYNIVHGNGLFSAMVDAMVELAYVDKNGKSHPYQNAPWYAAQTFSGAANEMPRSSAASSQAVLGGAYNRTETPGGLTFNPFFLLEAGTTMSVKLTPIYSGQRPPSSSSVPGADDRIYEYRLRAVLEGYKRVRR